MRSTSKVLFESDWGAIEVSGDVIVIKAGNTVREKTGKLKIKP